MRVAAVRYWLAIAAVVMLPMYAQAQEATVSGTIIDATGGALPGVVVRAVQEATGNSFETVTDDRGAYRLPVRVGIHRLSIELPGFATTTRTVTLLVGQQVVENIQMAPSALQETITVSGEAPLLAITDSSLGGNIDPRQMQDLPVSGRNWLDLALLAPGARSNAGSSEPTEAGVSGSRQARRQLGDWETNIDGQQVTSFALGGQAQFSRDAIAEFEFLSSRFDATQGRSFGIQVNAITKSGANVPYGSFSGYFRDDKFNAADHVANRVLPYQNTQLSGTYGGPIRRDRIHFFANYEYEREPQTRVYTTPYTHLNLDLSGTKTVSKAGGRLDMQFSPQTRLAFRATTSEILNLGSGSSNTSPSTAGDTPQSTTNLLLTLTNVFGNSSVNQIRAGYANYHEQRESLLTNPGLLGAGTFTDSAMSIQLRGLTAGGYVQWPDKAEQDVYSIRDDFTTTFTKGGLHTLKTGAEYLYMAISKPICLRCDGELDATSAPLTNQFLMQVFPNLFDVSTWKLDLLSPYATSYRRTIMPSDYDNRIPRYTTGAWVQDDWSISHRLTLNLGLRYDLELNAFANDVKMLPFLTGDQPNDFNNLAPRAGFTFGLNERTVVRGGGGLYFGTVQNAHFAKLYEKTVTFEIRNDGRPDFVSNPFNGAPPTFEQVLTRVCTPALQAGCLQREAPTGAAVYWPDFKMPHSHQASIGLQRQVASQMAFDVDYVYNGVRDQPRDVPVNLSYNPATGANYPQTDVLRRPYPNWGLVHLTINGQRSNYHALQTAFTRRFAQKWQASGTYTLSVLRDADPVFPSGLETVPFPLAPDFGGEYTLASLDQRHRAVFNGIWDIGHGFQLSGVYFYGSGQRRPTQWGVDLRGIGGGVRASEVRLRPDGTIVPRNAFVGDPIQRVDIRLQQRIPLLGRAQLDGIIEIFNLFDHANFGSYTTDEVSANYGKPSQNANVAYGPRTGQLGFRLTF